MKIKVRKGDTVRILAGKDRGKSGIVERVFAKDSEVVVTGLNLIKKHRRAKQGVKQSGIITLPAPMPTSKVMVVCPHCQKATRVAISIDHEGKNHRMCRLCKEVWESKEK